MMQHKDGDLLTITEAADTFGYSHSTMHAKVQPGNAHFDPRLYRLQIRTDESYRKAFDRPRAKFVYRYGDLRGWFNCTAE